MVAIQSGNTGAFVLSDLMILPVQRNPPLTTLKRDEFKLKVKPCPHHEPVLHGPLADPEARAGWGLQRQDALDGSIQLGGVHLVASHVQLCPVLLHEQRDVLPVARSQIHIFDGNHLLLVLGGENYVQGVCLAVGDDLKHGPGAVLLLHRKKAPPGPFELFEVEQQEESPLGVDGIDQVPKGAIGDWGDQVRVEDLVGGAVRIVSFHQGDPMVLSGDLHQLKQVIDAVVVSTLCG